MKIDEAIKHCEEVMMENLENTKDRNASDPIAINCFECADEHRQLAEWLKELKAHREAWKNVEDRIKITKLGYANSDSIACMAEIRAFNRSLEIIAECRPKEGDADEITK